MNDELEFSISQYLDGTLAASERAALEARLGSDAEARAILREQQALTGLLRSNALPAVQWDRLAASISAAVSQAEMEEAPAEAARPITADRSFWTRWRMPAGLAMAASMLLAVGLGIHVYLGHNHHDEVRPQVSPALVAELKVEGPSIEGSDGPVSGEVAVGPAGASDTADSGSSYADDVVSRPSRVSIASGMQPAQDTPSLPID